MKWKIAVVILIILLSMWGGARVYAALTDRAEEAERLSAEAKVALQDEKIAHAETREDLLFQIAETDERANETEAERAARLEVERELQAKVRVVGRLQARLANRPVEVRVVEASGPPAPPLVVTCPDGNDIVCPPCGPPTNVEIGGGADVQLVEIEGRQAATADWFATVTGDGWETSRGPERVEDVVYFVPPPDNRLARSTVWGAGVGLMFQPSPFDPELLASLRRSKFGKGKRWGYFVEGLVTSVPVGDVQTADTISYDQVGSYGLMLGLERRGGR